MGIGVQYNTSMGFALNGSAIPDPSSYDYSSQSLDNSAERDLGGLLHRNMVGIKRNVSLKWNALDYGTAKSIVQAVASPSVTFTFPCMEVTDSSGLYTGKYYSGDRKVSCLKAVGDEDKWIVSLAFDLIEY